MSSEKKNFELDRRSLLKNIIMGTGLGTSGLMNTFLTNMMVNFMQKGTAQAAGVDPAFEDFKFISLVMAGGFARYHWDLPINPNGNDAITYNPMVVTKFNPDGSSSYATTKIGNYYMPSLWDSKIPTVSGTTSMKDIARNMLIMRGIDLQIDSHEIDRTRQLAPIPGGVSITGLVADASSTPIPAVGRRGGDEYYQSKKGIAYLELGGTNPLTEAMSPFTPASSMLSLNNGAIENAIDQALLRMQASSAGKDKYLPSTYVSRFNAKKMMLRQFGNLQTQYTSLVNKYKSLISRSFGPDASLKFAGVEDRSIAGNRGLKQSVGGNTFFAGSDILTFTDETTSIYHLAEGMAIAEFMVVNGLSSSVNIESTDFAKTLIQQEYNPFTKVLSSVRTARATYVADVHYLGADMALILYTRYYRAISACLNELISKLKATKTGSGTLFDKTMIAVSSEFNRIPRADGSGSDHGFEGSNYTIFSGMVEGLQVVGNIKVAAGTARGTWGLAAPMPEIGGREAIMGNVASTVSNLLEIKTPTPNDSSFTVKENGKAKLVITSLKNVA